MNKVEIVTRTEGVGKYKGLTTEEITSAIARHGVIKEDKGKLVKYLMTEKHWSPLDMINFGFEVETSRAIARQWLRHSSIRPQEHSQRYSDRVMFENIELRLEHPTNRQSSTETVCIVSKEEKATYSMDILDTGQIKLQENKYREYGNKVFNLLTEIENLYKEGIELGLAKECVRMILPECTTTTLTFNGSLRSWLSFLNVRCDHHSQKEIVILATQVGELLEKEMPNVFAQIDWRKGMFM
jgi:thymidylate synthase (FAD)